MKQLTQRAATVELAIESALQDLGVTRDQVEIEVIENGRKGFLGFGSKQAVVRVILLETALQTVEASEPAFTQHSQAPELDAETPAGASTLDDVIESSKEVKKSPLDKVSNEAEAIEETKAYISAMAKEMGITDLVVTYETKGKYINFQLESEKAAFLIGKRGQTLNAIQQLAQLVTNKVARQFKIVRIDVADYRERREQSLEQLADRMADRAIRTKRQVALEPMPSYERKVIHNALSSRLDVETFSDGKDPYRHIVIKAFE